MGNPSTTASALVFDFSRIYSGQSRADEVQVLLVKNKPPRKYQHGAHVDDKPGGWGCPTGQAESGEVPHRTVLREMKAESGYSGSVIGEVMTVEKTWIKNTIHVFLVEPGDYPGNITERDEIADMRWASLRDIVLAPPAVGQNKERNPEGVYTSHLNRLLDAVYMILQAPEELVESAKILSWMRNNPREVQALREAIQELHDEKLLEQQD